MATMRWVGRALPVAQVGTLVVGGTWAANDTVALTMNGKSIVLTVGATVTTAAVATALKEMWNGDTITGDATRSETGDNVPEFAEATATVAASTVTLTGDTKGKPFTVSRTISSASGTVTLTNAAVAATGPNHWDNANNWSGGAVPAAGDTVYVDNSDVSILYGLAQSGVTLAALYVGQSFTGAVGLPERNTDGGAYSEYRAQYLAVGATVLQIGAGAGGGSGRIKIDTGTVQTALSVYGSGFGAEPNLPAVLWKGTHASNALVQTGGSVGAAVFGGEVATLATVAKSGGDLLCGPAVTLSGALANNGGGLTIGTAVATSLTVTDGAVVLQGSGAVAQLTVRGGRVAYNTTGTLGGATVVSGTGVLDFTGDPVAKTVTNPIDLHGTQCLVDDSLKVLGSVVADFNEGADPSQFRFGPNSRLTRGAVA